MKHKNRVLRLSIVGISILAITTSLTGCGIASSLSREEKLKGINEIADAIDYPSTGEIIEEEYKVSSTTLEGSSLVVTLGGEEAFEKIKNNILQIDGVNCIPVTDGTKTVSCDLEDISIGVTVIGEETNSPNTRLRISDPTSGRSSQ